MQVGIFHPIYTAPCDTLDWIVPGLLPVGYLTLLAGAPKSGKTSFATALALAVATGTRFAGLETNQSSVLWVSAEEGPEERNILLSQSELAIPLTPLYTAYEPFAVETEESLEILQDAIFETKAKLVVIDPLHGATCGRSLQDGWAARKTLAPLKRFCILKRITALVLHHSTRSGREHRADVAESSQLSATASMSWVLQNQTPTGNKERSLLLTSRGRGEFANRHWHIRSPNPMSYEIESKPMVVSQAIRPKDTWASIILAFLKNGPADSNQIIIGCQANPSSVRNSLTILRKDGKIIAEDTPDGNIYSLAPDLTNSFPKEEPTEN